MKHHQIRLVGAHNAGPRISAGLLAKVLNTFASGSKASVRYLTEGRSNARGSAPNWLENAADFEVTGLTAGSTVVQIDARSLIEAEPDKFQQQNLFWNLDPNRSGFELFEDALTEAIEGKADSELYDATLLSICAGLHSVFNDGIQEIELSNGRPGKLSVCKEGIERVKQLKIETPPPRRVRIAGKLDCIRATGLFFELVLEGGEKIKGVLSGLQPEELRQFFNQDVVISGTAEFRPSGQVLRLDAESIEKAVGNQSLWSKMPRPVRTHSVTKLRQPQDARSGLAAIIGQWPGEESDEETEKLLAELA